MVAKTSFMYFNNQTKRFYAELITPGGRKRKSLKTSDKKEAERAFQKLVAFSNIDSDEKLLYEMAQLNRLRISEKSTGFDEVWKVFENFPPHHALDIQPEILFRMRDAFRVLKFEGKLCHGSGKFHLNPVENGDKILPPCGNCRQILSDYAPDCEVILSEEDKVSARNLFPIKQKHYRLA